MHCKTLLIAFLLLTASYTQANTVAIVGDSLSAGYGLPADSGWVNLLQQRLGDAWRVHNASISGATTANALDYIDQVLDQEPEVLIIALGGNDALRGFNLDSVSANLAELISKAQQNQAQVLLVGIDIPINYGNRYREALRQMYEQLAEQYQTALLPFLLEGFARDQSYFQADGIHPNASAQELILANVWQYLDTMLQHAR